MNTFKALGIALVVCFSLLLNGVACVLIAMSMKQQPPISDADVVVAGVGNSGNDISMSSSPRKLARRVTERHLAPPVTDAMLQSATNALIDKGIRGEPDAAAFLFELAAAQRAKAGATTSPSDAPDDDE
jgi:hypothetical protein